ncbi:hypothetical protein C4J87_0963 [Pseudomonas sp. R1-43-08]|uniref:hypothetical protein n=1 Tax=Pseudomonas sp. R1-43-08 TaxID=1173270 RepID=UPI000F56570B|nr:hypothetical protein [Pseudomonas sp. R1-43-08]AZF41138.1 hypothetical protein C4J87_0963 [Pseudomonas sp. R1-43-08]
MIRQSNNMRLSHFKVRFADGTDYTDALYANGHHQVEIVVEVLKEVIGRLGSWNNVALTDSERASIKIVPVLMSVDQSQAVGWAFDAEKNEYDSGLWNRTGEAPGGPGPNSVIVDPRIEIIRRYVRVEEISSLEPIQLMATIILDGEGVTRSYSEYPTDFQSSVFIAPVAPPVLLSTELDLITDYFAFDSVGVDVDMYYWDGVNGLRFVDNYGLAEPLYVPNEGTVFQTSYGFSNAYKGGVFKGVASVDLRLSMVHQNLPALSPGEDPTFIRKWNRIMCAVRLHTSIPDLPQTDSQSKWLLRDNFGTLHVFKIVPHEDGNRMNVAPVQLRRRPKHLRITTTNGQDTTDALYANSRHQCKVSIELSVEQEGVDGLWEEVRPRADEKDSATITLYSANANQPLPAGWACDTARNIYEIGLWNRSVEGGKGDETEEQITQQKMGLPNAIEIIDRFMRLETGASIEARRLMARIVIDGKVYTTNFSDAEINFDSWVHISPRQPFRVRVADLVRTVDHAYWEFSTDTDIDVWYWLPPPGLKFVSQMGLDSPMWLFDEGIYFQTTFVHRSDKHYRKVGVVIGHDIPGANPKIYDIHRTLPDPTHRVPFNRVNTIMRAMWVSGKKGMPEGDARTPWRLLDNYGCMHAYTMQRRGNNIELLDYEN